ncbi:MAG: putative calcium-binding protein [Chloroflexi bacterium]|nr:MAG: putative calcium-binding protein [Chloroflexota bacterium]
MKIWGFLFFGIRHFSLWVVMALLVLQTTSCDELLDDFTAESNADKTQWYVSTTGDDKNPCHTQKNPCRKITTAIERAKDGDTIHIADGKYFEQLTLTKELKIYGESMSNTIIDAQLIKRPLTLDGLGRPNGFNLDLKNVTLTGGAIGKGGGFFAERGFYVVLTNVEIRNNVGHSAGGGIYSINTARLILNNVSIHDNHTGVGGEVEGKGGGIFFGTGDENHGYFPASFILDITGSHIFANSSYYGAGIYNEATLNVIKSTIESNTAEAGGGGVYNEYDATIGQSKILKNAAQVGGGVENVENLLHSSTVPGLNVFESTFSGNTAVSRAGISNQTNLSLISSTISENIASNSGGGILNSTFLANKNIYGFFAINSSISNNSAAVGGGIWNGKAEGGGYQPGYFEGTNLTIANNTGGGLFYHFGSLKLTNVLFSYNTDDNCDFTAAAEIFSSLSSDDTCPGFIVADSMIRDLGDNGGSTETHALLPGSPARDAGTPIQGLFTDQRQFPSPLDGDGDGIAKIDIGAFEAEYQVFQPIIIEPIVTETPSPVRTRLHFTPDKRANCRRGYSIYSGLTGIAEIGIQYPLEARNSDSNWFYIALNENVKCWVSASTGRPSGDTLVLNILYVNIPTATLTPTPVPCVSYSASNCPVYCNVEKYPSGESYCTDK